MGSSRILLLSALAMVAFAANSLLCRLALGDALIDAASFTTVRTLCGALTLVAILQIRGGQVVPLSLSWRSAVALVVYMVFFSFAYISLQAGTGALILFGTVQLTMLGFAILGGERLTLLAWAGTLLAVGGLVYLVLPGLRAPDPLGAVLMAIAGVGWGVYSLLGRSMGAPLAATASNFLYALPLTILLSLFFVSDFQVSPSGVLYAGLSGAIASGCGYAIWYAALAGLTASRAAIIQLSVPVIAAFGGVLFLSEDISLRLVIASAVTLGGVALVLTQRMQKT